jgi:toxin ParE1/3/4
MASYRLTNKAVEDLNQIWEYSFVTWSGEQADYYYQMLISICEDLAENPGIGRAYFTILPGLLGFIANKHIIFYRVIEVGLIEIVRILHGRVDIKNRIKE